MPGWAATPQSRVSTARSCHNGSYTTIQRFPIRSAEENQPTDDSATSFTRQPVRPHQIDTSTGQCPKNRTAASHRIPTRPNTATSGIKCSHRISQTQSLQPVPPHFIQAPAPRWSFIHDPLNPCISLCPCRPPLASIFASPINHQQVPQTSHSPLRPFVKCCFLFFFCPLFSRSVSLKFRRPRAHSSSRLPNQVYKNLPYQI